jgi:uncharacterized repeat protein (TIGR03803 family)
MLTLTWIASAGLHAQTSYQVIHHFSASTDGSRPNGLTRDAAGNFYGTTSDGGPSGLGTVFKLDAATHAVTVLHNFTDTPDGANPMASVTLDPAGNLYGTTRYGGSDGLGAVFKIDSSGVETIVHSFIDWDGLWPSASLVRDPAGNLYGTTSNGGSHTGGVIFKIGPAGVERTVYQFEDQSASPNGLARGAAGSLYGTTVRGGHDDVGTVFRLRPGPVYILVHSFTGGSDGGSPQAESLLDDTGNLYSTTTYGGDFGAGTVFKVDSTGVFSVLHSFSGPDGFNPLAGLVMDASGNLYGTAFAGGDSNQGVVFKLDPSGNEAVLHSFAGGADGAHPMATLVLSPDGTLFGSTSQGGFHGDGTIFRLKP